MAAKWRDRRIDGDAIDVIQGDQIARHGETVDSIIKGLQAVEGWAGSKRGVMTVSAFPSIQPVALIKRTLRLCAFCIFTVCGSNDTNS